MIFGFLKMQLKDYRDGDVEVALFSSFLRWINKEMHRQASRVQQPNLFDKAPYDKVLTLYEIFFTLIYGRILSRMKHHLAQNDNIPPAPKLIMKFCNLEFWMRASLSNLLLHGNVYEIDPEKTIINKNSLWWKATSLASAYLSRCEDKIEDNIVNEYSSILNRLVFPKTNAVQTITAILGNKDRIIDTCCLETEQILKSISRSEYRSEMEMFAKVSLEITGVINKQTKFNVFIQRL